MILLLFTVLLTGANAANVISLYGDVHRDVEFFTRTFPWIIDNIGGELIVEYNLLGSGRYSIPQMCALEDLKRNTFLQAQYLKCEAEGKPSGYCLCEAGIDPHKFKQCVASGGFLASLASAKYTELGIKFSPVIELEPNNTVYEGEDIWFLNKVCSIFGNNLPRGCVNYSDSKSFPDKKAHAQFDRACDKEFPISGYDDNHPTTWATTPPPPWSTTPPPEWFTTTTPSPTPGCNTAPDGWFTTPPPWSTTPPPWPTTPPPEWFTTTTPSPTPGCNTAPDGWFTTPPPWSTTPPPEWSTTTTPNPIPECNTAPDGWFTTPPPWTITAPPWSTTPPPWWSTTSPPWSTTPPPWWSTTSPPWSTTPPPWWSTTSPPWWSTTSPPWSTTPPPWWSTTSSPWWWPVKSGSNQNKENDEKALPEYSVNEKGNGEDALPKVTWPWPVTTLWPVTTPWPITNTPWTGPSLPYETTPTFPWPWLIKQKKGNDENKISQPVAPKAESEILAE